MNTNCSNDITNLLNILRLTGKKYDTEKITRAYEYARDLHEGQFRVSGEPYISHPIAVAEIVAGLELDTDSICAALLHDTVEDCSDRTDLKVIEKKFGSDVAILVDGLTKMIQLNFEDKEEAHIENLRKMLLAMSKDIRVIFIKLCDRLHNMRTLAVKRDDKRRKTALETMQVFAPLAHRLGMQKIKHELENIGLSYLDPFGYSEITQHIENKYGENAEFIGNIRKAVEEKLNENNINFTLEGRIKSVYSIYRKMYTQNKSFDEIYDFYALRIIVDTELECYTALGIIHEMFKSIPGRFKDYISTPKSNLYQSLHTTVIGREGIPFEVQIRTWDMHHIAEYGIAAHWKYKSGEKSKEDMDKKLEWIARLIETEDDTRDPDEFIHAIKTDMFQDETFIFTPKGDVIALPHGSTVIDFAYAIHSGVGNSMTGAKINGMIVPIDRVPQNGEIVEILTSSSSKGPSRDWLKIVKTSEARTKIRAWFKKEKRPENIIAGKAIVDNEFKKIGKTHTEAQRNEIIANIAQRVGFASSDDLYNTLGYGGLSISKISLKIVEEFDRVVKVSEPVVPKSEVEQIKEQIKNVQPKNTKSNNSVIVDGEKGCLVKFAHCCNPLPGDDIIGFVTKGFGVSIHKCDCPNVNNSLKDESNRSRWLNARWELSSHTSSDMYEAHLRIFVQDRIGILADISVALADMKVYILQINTIVDAEDNSIVNLKVSCKNVEHYHSIVSRLKSVRGVIDVVRGFS